MNKDFIKLVGCPEIQSRWKIRRDDKVMITCNQGKEYWSEDRIDFFNIENKTVFLMEHGNNYKVSELIFLPSLGWLINECEKEIVKAHYVEKYCVDWRSTYGDFIEWDDNRSDKSFNKEQDHKTVWVEYLLYLIRGNQNDE